MKKLIKKLIIKFWVDELLEISNEIRDYKKHMTGDPLKDHPKMQRISGMLDVMEKLNFVQE